MDCSGRCIFHRYASGVQDYSNGLIFNAGSLNSQSEKVLSGCNSASSCGIPINAAPRRESTSGWLQNIIHSGQCKAAQSIGRDGKFCHPHQFADDDYLTGRDIPVRAKINVFAPLYIFGLHGLLSDLDKLNGRVYIEKTAAAVPGEIKSHIYGSWFQNIKGNFQYLLGQL